MPLSLACPGVVEAPDNLVAREDTLFGAWLCGTVLAQVGMALHHKLCHTPGGTLNLPHAETHAIVLPHAIAYNEVVAAEVLGLVARLFNSGSAAVSRYDFAKRMGAPLALGLLGVTEADLAVLTPYPDPRRIERNGVRQLLQDAWLGHRPFSS